MRASGPAIAAAVVLTLEGIAIAVLGGIELLALGGGQTADQTGAIALIVLTLIAAAGLLAFAVGTLRRASWARSGGVVFQVLGIALALASLSIEPKIWTFTLVVGGAGLVGLILLLRAHRHDGLADARLRHGDADD